jgi:hypothetical protein
MGIFHTIFLPLKVTGTGMLSSFTGVCACLLLIPGCGQTDYQEQSPCIG